MWIVWTGGNDRFWDGMTASTFGAFDLLKIVAYDPTQPVDRDNALELSRARQRALLRPADRADPNRFGLLARSCAARTARADPFENETKYPGVAIGARGKTRAGGLLSTAMPTRHRRPAALSQPGFRRARRSALGRRRAITTIPTTTTTASWCGPIASACPAASATSGPSPINPPADPRNPQWAEPQFDRRRAVHVGRPALRLDSARRRQLHVPARAHLSPGRDGHVAGLDRQHQQPAHDERGLPPRRRGSSIAQRWGQETLAGGELNNKQFNDYRRRAGR